MARKKKKVKASKVKLQTYKEFLAADMLKHGTKAEKKFLRYSKSKGFVCQAVIEPYIVDFLHENSKIIVEIDGIIHSYRKTYDSARDKFLEDLGYKVVRYSNNLIINDLPFVIKQLNPLIKKQTCPD